jgi:glycosyltransferase involved in cell wall biosynthesis
MSKVSVIIPAYNGSPTIGGTLRSVLSQTLKDFEVIVVDDGSTDSTIGVVRQVMPSARILAQANSGTMAAREAGIKVAKGEFVAFLDQDDLWFPELLQSEVAELTRDESVGVVLSNMEAVGERGSSLGFNVVPPNKCFDPSWEQILLLHPIATSTAVFRRSVLDRIGPLDTGFGFSGALGDTDTLLRVLETTRVRFVNRPLGQYFWSESRPGRLVSFLANLEHYTAKYLTHPRLSGPAAARLKLEFELTCGRYSQHILRLLENSSKDDQRSDLARTIQRHQGKMRKMLGASYTSIPRPKRITASSTQARTLQVLGRYLERILPLGTRRRSKFGPLIAAVRVLLTEGPGVLGRKTFHFLFVKREDITPLNDTPSVRLTDKLKNSKPPRVLVLDDYIPAIRYGSGFPRLYKMLVCLAQLDYPTTFFPVGNSTKAEPETSELQKMGIEVFWGSATLEEFASSRRGFYDVVMISRPHVFRRIHKAIVEAWPNAAIIYDAEALFYARDIVVSELSGKTLQESQKAKLAREEMELIERADAVIAVSEKTKEIMLQASAQKEIVVWQHIQDTPGTTVPFSRREGLLHFGSFFAGPGSPNEDAVLYFVAQVMPEIRLADSLKLYVVGTSPTPAVAALSGPDIEVVGYVDDPKIYFNKCRVNVVPTRMFATGTPLKLIEAMGSGIPSVVNGPIARHLGLVDGREVLVADSATEFAAKVLRLNSDEPLWNNLRDNSIRYVQDNYSHSQMLQRMDSAIRLAMRARRARDSDARDGACTHEE